MLQNEFNHQILKHTSPETTIVLALSGGMDSRVLLYLLSHMAESHHIKTKAVHIHHGLSSNADDWQKNCQAWCEKANVPFFSERVVLDIESGRSVEELAREARYDVLRRYVGPDDVLLTGQHMSDQTETFLLALKRGSGPKGLSGMPRIASFGEGEILRPLLSVSRQDIEQYALEHKLSWNHDESNDDTQFDRNFLRHRVVPELANRWSGFEKSVQRSAQLCADQQNLIEELLSQNLSDALFHDGSLSISMLSEQSELARAQLIRMWLEYSGAKMPSRKQLQVIWENVACSQRDANPSLSLPSGEIRRYDHRLYLVSPEQDLSDWCEELIVGKTLLLPYALGELTLGTSGLNTSLSNSVSVHSLLLRLPLSSEKVTVHFCPQGLSAKPVGRNGSRKLKKLFQEYGVPSWKRRQIPIVMYDDKVAAVANLFVTQGFNASDCELVWIS
ncbi:tRNA lysidine(34) synthetase TilS [Vibrio penaeicida]|uniref:tRNA lysidine(34) synthetase TilS n=1 Tax=Vibrio penaeicida TaxID=104609 RepID=UPI002736C54F|nr:tRNA lysidine(34) synthetase TilS [Vibrio penaeicida]MDP2574031.1 tRNA lysidine(34) synthetase TilS [Vibrio penaeicida]